MKKIILWSTVSILFIGILAASIWWLRRPQIIQLDKNTKLTLLGVEYGKHHKFPAVKTKIGHRTDGDLTSFDTTNDMLVVWILQETKGQQRYGWQAFISDHDETAGAMSWARQWNSVGANKQIAAIQMDAFPRWDRKFYMRFTSWGSQGQHTTKEQFVVSNPACKTSFPRWTAESVPDMQSDADLTVTLEKINYNVPYNNGGNGVPTSAAASKAVFVQFHTEQKGVVVTNWQPIRIETSDASGNHIQNWSWSNSREEDGDAKMTYQWGLWPAQMPWKLRVEFSKQSNFGDDELWSVTNVPVKPGSQQDLWNYNGQNSRANAAFAETDLNGLHLKLFPVIQFTDQNSGNGKKRGGFRIEANQPLDGMQMTLVKATDDQGRDVQSWSGQGWGGNSRQLQFQNLRNAKTLNLTIALHKSRFVEFTVKPEKSSDTNSP